MLCKQMFVKDVAESFGGFMERSNAAYWPHWRAWVSWPLVEMSRLGGPIGQSFDEHKTLNSACAYGQTGVIDSHGGLLTPHFVKPAGVRRLLMKANIDDLSGCRNPQTRQCCRNAKAIPTQERVQSINGRTPPRDHHETPSILLKSFANSWDECNAMGWL